MPSVDQFDQIAAEFLISDAELALTFVQIALSRPEGENRARPLQYAALAYLHICESMCLVRIDDQDLTKLGSLIENLRLALDAGANGHMQ